MKRRQKIAIVITVAIFLGIGAIAYSVTQASWNIGTRTVPVPASASDVIRNLIMKTPAPDVAKARQHTPKSEAEWVAWIAKIDADWSALCATLAKQFSVSVERDEIEGVMVRHVMPANIDPKHQNHLFIHLHGGAYVLGAGDAGVREAIVIADRVKIPVLSIDYRMPPQHPFPAAVDDVVTVYRYLLRSRPANSMAMGGTSAGGGLTLSSTHKFIQLGLEVPGALFAGTPWADLTKTGDSQFTNEGLDRILVTYDGFLRGAALLYAGGRDLKDPLVSPVYGNFQGFSPTFLVTGTRDLFLSDTARTHRKMRTAGVIADLSVYEGLSHAEYTLVSDSPESQQVLLELNAFLLKQLQ